MEGLEQYPEAAIMSSQGGGDYENGRGGAGGAGGHGGTGGEGSGNGHAGHPGEPGEPGEPGLPAQVNNPPWYNLPLATLLSLMLALLGGSYWLFGLEARINAVGRDATAFRENVLNLNTPLSQRVIALEPRIAEIARVQSEVRLLIASLDQNGTTQNKILKRDVDSMRADIAGQSIRCQETQSVVGKLQTDIIETRVKLQYLLEALAPHTDRGRK